MGHLFYGSAGDPILIPDAMLAHVQRVMTTKLRRGECFTLTWRHTADQPGGRSTIWVQPSIALRFVFDTADHLRIDAATLNRLAVSASSTTGLVLDLHAAPEEDHANVELMLTA